MGNGSKGCDVAVITVIGPELLAIRKALGVATTEPESDSGNQFWIVEVPNDFSKRRPLRVVIYAIGSAGEAPAHGATTWVRIKFKPAAAILCGISAGRRDKIKIGDVVLSRSVVDYSMEVAQDGRRLPRIAAPTLPLAMQQILASYTLDRTAFQNGVETIFGGILTAPPTALAEFKKQFARHVNLTPTVEDSDVATSNLLLKDSEILENLSTTVHQGIKIGEMEAGGFVQACLRDNVPTCWLVVRCVSDFGDKFKSNDFHQWASCAAASWVSLFLRHGFRLETVRDIEPPAELDKLTRFSEIGRNDAGFVQRGSETEDEIRLDRGLAKVA